MDIDLFIFNKKRKHIELDDDGVLKLKNNSINALLQVESKCLNFKNNKLRIFLDELKNDINNYILCLNDNQLKNEFPQNIIISLIAELSMTCQIIDEISESSKNGKTFNQLINDYKENISKKVKSESYEEYETETETDESYRESSEEESSKESSKDKIKEEFVKETTEIFKNNKNLDGRERIVKYFNDLKDKQKNIELGKIKEINNYNNNDKPLFFKIINYPLDVGQRNHILNTYSSLLKNTDEKLQTWFDSLIKIPFGEYKGISLTTIKTKKVKTFLNKLKTNMDNAVYGHDDAKRHIIQMMGQQIRNPNSKGNILGIWGPPGNGKTSLIKEGIAKAMDKPFIFISLGGATDASFLEGHNYTYEGSIYGRIVDGLITSKCMDPIFYFDELDKISSTDKGEEISNILIHLTDPVQNTQFRDKYFHGIDIDLSRATFIFSFNNPSNINHILLDRITTVETKYLLHSQKLHIVEKYLLPEIIKDVGLNKEDIIIDNDCITNLINKYTNEGGVRKLKSLLYNIIREVNIANMTKTKINNKDFKFPFTISLEDIKLFLKNKHEIVPEIIHTENKCGVINGMYATNNGNGGILPIELSWCPSNNPFEMKTTGNLQLVIKESTSVASTVAFNCINKDKQDELLISLKEKPRGIHIHCPDGSVPKDGPSAGVALTIAIYSLLNDKKIKNDIAITGEINLQGNVTAIGGLESKLEGAKKAGIKLALYPKENEKDIIKIKERNPTLIDDNLKVIPINNIHEALKYALV